MCSCASEIEESNHNFINDDLGRSVLLKNDIDRIFALSPALTEVLFFSCPDSLIVARTQACDYPEAALEKPVISTYPFDIESIISMKPDLVLTEKGITSPEQIEILEKNHIPTYVFQYKNVEDILETIKKVGDFCDCTEETRSKVISLQKELEELKYENLANKKVLGLIWSDPIYVYGKNTLFSDQLRVIGLTNAIDSVFLRPYPEISREYFLRVNPDIIFGSGFEHLDSTLFKEYPELKRVKAYRDSSIYFINGDILTRPGPRSFEAMRQMKEVSDEY